MSEFDPRHATPRPPAPPPDITIDGYWLNGVWMSVVTEQPPVTRSCANVQHAIFDRVISVACAVAFMFFAFMLATTRNADDRWLWLVGAVSSAVLAVGFYREARTP